MDQSLAAHYLENALEEYRTLKKQAEKAASQVDDRQFFALPSPESNSIAIVMKHMAGNMRSRWSEFLSSDGEKPDRQRDREFEIEQGESRAVIEEKWQQGWKQAFEAIGSLQEQDLLRSVYIRGRAHTVVEAIERQLTHYAGHVGQILFLARFYRGADWKTLSIPPGQSEAFNVAWRARLEKESQG